VKEYLDIREINGYSIQYVPFHKQPDKTADDSTTNGPNQSIPEGGIECLV
jgi:hypothetical protein